MDASTPFLNAALNARLIAVFLATGVCLSGCESQTSTSKQPIDHLAELIQTIKDIKVEDDGTAVSGPHAQPQPQTLGVARQDANTDADYWRKGAELVLNTGKDIALSDDGLVSVRPQFEIKVISASEARSEYVAPTKLDVTPYSDESVAPTPITATKPASEAALKSMPSLPLGIENQVAKPVAAVKENAPKGRLIQVGAFSTLEAAQAAMTIILANHPKLAALRPHMETVTTPAGQRVRLKIGPIADQATAERLCQDLRVTDNWCVRAG